jgi:hypothetical protein
VAWSVWKQLAVVTQRLTPRFLVGPAAASGTKVSVLSPWRHRNLAWCFALFVSGDRYVLDTPPGREPGWEQEELARLLEAHYAPASIDVLIAAGHGTCGGPTVLNSDTPLALRRRIAARLRPGATVVLWTCSGVHEGNRQLAQDLGATLLVHPGFTVHPGGDVVSLFWGRWVALRPDP